MPRALRVIPPGVPVHIVQRGNNRRRCFFDADDFASYLHLLCKGALTIRCEIHAYCLMPNHVHLLLTAREPDGCSLLMKGLNQAYTQRVNRLRSRTGTLWEGRYRSKIIDSESYVLACYRYIESNPVRASIVARARQYPWSSFGANADGESNPLVTPHAVYQQLGITARERSDTYRNHFDIPPSPRALDLLRVSATRGRPHLRTATMPRELSTGV